MDGDGSKLTFVSPFLFLSVFNSRGMEKRKKIFKEVPGGNQFLI